jgi:hypothetical protein
MKAIFPLIIFAFLLSCKGRNEQKSNDENNKSWSIGRFVDEFGEPTNISYITTTVYGTFSNTATENSPLRVVFIITKDNKISLQLYEYNKNIPVKGYKDSYQIYVQDKDGNRHTLAASNYNSDRLSLTNYSYSKKLTDTEKLHNILTNGGEIKFVIIDENRASSVYRFKIDNADWYENAFIKLTDS